MPSVTCMAPSDGNTTRSCIESQGQNGWVRSVLVAVVFTMAAALKAFSSTTSKKWVPDQSYDSCFGCLRKFNMFNRRHHCRLCGQLFCKACSASRIELSRDQGFVRICDSCSQKHRSAINPSSPIAFHSPTEKVSIPLPKSIFANVNSQANRANMVLSIGSSGPAVSSARLTPTLTCNCYADAAPDYIEGVQSAHFAFNSNRLRLDVQFRAEGWVIFSARLHASNVVYVGAGAAHIQTEHLDGQKSETESEVFSMGLIDDFSTNLYDIKTGVAVGLSGSLAWTLNHGGSAMPTTDQAAENMVDTKTPSSASKASLLKTIESEIASSYSMMTKMQEEEDQGASQKSNLSMDGLDRWRASHLPTNIENLSTNENRRNDSIISEVTASALTARAQLQIKIDQLKLMKECITRANKCIEQGEAPEDAPFSCMCFYCFGTIIV